MVGRRICAIVLAAGAALAASWAAAVVTADDPVARPEGRTLTAAELGGFLKEAGLVPREENGILRVQRQPGAGIYCLVSLSPDGRYVWISAPLADLPKERPYPRQRLVELLTTNASTHGVHFGLVGDSLQIFRAVDNRALLPAALGQEVDAFFGVMIGTARTWDVRGWGATLPPGAAMGESPPPEPSMGEPAMTEGR